MDDEMDVVISYQTWDLVPIFSEQTIISYRWMFTIKHLSDGTVYRYKARLLAQGFT